MEQKILQGFDEMLSRLSLVRDKFVDIIEDSRSKLESDQYKITYDHFDVSSIINTVTSTDRSDTSGKSQNPEERREL